MKPGLAKTIEKVRISWYFECPEADFHLAENTSCINCANTWSPKRVTWLSRSQSQHCSSSDYGCVDKWELYSGVGQERLLLTGSHTWVASKPKIQRIPAAIHNSGWMDDFEVCHVSIDAILILDTLDVEEAYSHIASHYHSVQWHVRSHGWRDVSFGQEKDSMEGRLIFRCEVSSTQGFQILCRSHYNDGDASGFPTHPRSFPEVEIV